MRIRERSARPEPRGTGRKRASLPHGGPVGSSLRFRVVYSRSMRLVLIVLVVLLGLVAMFAIQNPVIVTVNFLNYSTSTSILVLIVAAFGTGVLVGLLPGIPTSIRRRRRIRELEADLAARRKSEPPPPPVTP